MKRWFRNAAEQARHDAVAAWESVLALPPGGAQARSLRLRMGMLCTAHLDKTFIAGARQTEAWEAAAALALARGEERPQPPQAVLFQALQSSRGEVLAYLPREHADEAFRLGSLYQRTTIGAAQAVEAMQALADRICVDVLQLAQPLPVLRFLRDELEAGATGAPPPAGDAPPGADPA